MGESEERTNSIHMKPERLTIQTYIDVKALQHESRHSRYLQCLNKLFWGEAEGWKNEIEMENPKNQAR